MFQNEPPFFAIHRKTPIDVKVNSNIWRHAIYMNRFEHHDRDQQQYPAF